MCLKSVIYQTIFLLRRIRKFFYVYWNRYLFYVNNIKFGKKLQVYNNVYVMSHSTSKIIVGDNFVFTSGECYNPLCRNIKGCIVAKPNAEIIIGNNVGVSSPCIWSHKKIAIGNNVKIGGDCILMDSDAHSLNYLDRRVSTIDKENKKDAPIIIEDDVLIGTRCIILKGVTIGARSVIGSGSIVTKSIPADSVAVGNPCRVIKTLN